MTGFLGQGACGRRTVLLAAVALLPGAAAAAPAEIVVTGAVTAFSAQALELRGIESLRQLDVFVPGLFASQPPGIGSGAVFTLRGQRDTGTLATSAPAVATIVDGIYIGRQIANNFSMFDVKSIEVLRGPQGVLYGRNTIGGVVNIVNIRPGTKVAGFGEFSYGAYDRKAGRASIDLPLTSTVGMKLSGYFQDGDGYVRNTVTGERLNDDDGAGARLALRWDLTPTVGWDGAVAYMRADGENVLNFDCDPATPADCGGRFASTGLRATTSSYAPLAISGAKAEYGLGNSTDTLLASSRFEWAGDAVTLRATTAFVDTGQRYALDFADGRTLPDIADPQPVVRGDPLGGLTLLETGDHRQFSQEITFSGALFGDRLTYVTGFSYFNEKNNIDRADILAGGSAPQLLADRTLAIGTSAVAGWLLADLGIADRLTLTAGVRYTDETRTLRIFDNRDGCVLACLNQAALVAIDGTPIPTRQQAGHWTPRFGLRYKAAPDLMLFAGASRGYRSAGWNGAGRNGFEVLAFGPETAWSYEVGARSTWFDGRLRADATVFWLEVERAQVPVLLSDASGATVIQNAAGYRNRGLEVELVAAPVEGLSLFLNLAVQDDSWRLNGASPGANGTLSVAAQQAACRAQLAAGQLPLSPNSAAPGLPANNAAACAAGIVAAAGDLARPTRTPALGIAAGGSYDFKVPAGGFILTPSATLSYRSSYDAGPANATIFAGSVTAGAGGDNRTFPANPFGGKVISGSRDGGFVVANAALTLRTDDGNWTLALECFNCLDTDWVESTVANTGYLAPPRAWQVRLKRVL